MTNDDGNVESDESFPVLLAGGVDYTVDPVNNGSTAIIHDNDVAPLVSVAATDGAGTETIDGTDFTFTFSRTGSTSSALTVNYSIFPAPVDGATPGVDFPAQTGTITFAAGSSTAVLQFSAIDDAIIENTELFSVVVGVGAGYQVDFPNAIGGRLDHRQRSFPPAVVSLTPATVETTEGGSLTFTFTRSGGNLAAPLTINYVVNDGPPLGGATRADGDFSYASGMQQLTFAAGQTVATITVVTNDDGNVETDESFPVLLAGGVDYTVDPVNNGSTAVIHDNDVAPLVSVAATDGVGTETDRRHRLHLHVQPHRRHLAAPLTVNYSVIPAPVDGATRRRATSRRRPARSPSRPAAAPPCCSCRRDRRRHRRDRRELSRSCSRAASSYTGRSSATASARGRSTTTTFPPAVVSLTPAVVETTEGGSLTFTFTRSGGNLAAPLTINYVVNDGPPLGGATRADGDFSYASGMQQLTFAAGQTVATITVVTNDDANVETDESFPVLLAGGVDYTVDPVNNGSTAVIHDNDVVANPLVSVVATDGIGTETVDGTDFTFTFSRTGSTAAALTVNYTIQPGADRRRDAGRGLPGADRYDHVRGGQRHGGALLRRDPRCRGREHRVLLGRGRRGRRLRRRYPERDRECIDRGWDHHRDERGRTASPAPTTPTPSSGLAATTA